MFWTTFVFMYMLKTYSHTFSLSHSFNLSFNHSRHAEQVLFSSLCSKLAVYRRKLQCFFSDLHHHTTLTCYVWVHRAGSQLKMGRKKNTDLSDTFFNVVHVRCVKVCRVVGRRSAHSFVTAKILGRWYRVGSLEPGHVGIPTVLNIFSIKKTTVYNQLTIYMMKFYQRYFRHY